MPIPNSRKELKKLVVDIVNRPLPDDMEKAYTDLPDAFDSAHKRATERRPGIAIPGHKLLSQACDGIRERGFTVICGPSGKGKTTFLANLWHGFHAAGLPIFAAPVENGRDDFVEMIVSIISGKSRNAMTPQEWEQVKSGYRYSYFAGRSHVFSNAESRLSHLDMLTDIYHAYLTKGTRIALCDNWQFMQDFSDDRNAMAKSDKALHEVVVFTKHVPLHLFMVMHPNKEGMERVANETQIKGSSTAVQEAHNVWLFNPLDPKEEAPFMKEHALCREVKIAKARYNGRATMSRVIYAINPTSDKYEEHSVR